MANMNIFGITILTETPVEHVTRSGKIKTDYVRTPVREIAVEAENMAEAQHCGRMIVAETCNVYALPTVCRVTVLPAPGREFNAAAAIVRTVLSRCETRQPVFRAARVSIDAAIALARDGHRPLSMHDVAGMHDVAQDLMQVVAEAYGPLARMLDGDKTGRMLVEYDCAVCESTPYWTYRGFAYAAVNRYIDARREGDTRTAYKDVLGLLRASEERIDAMLSADYDSGYYAGELDAPTDLIYSEYLERWDDMRRDEYMAHRRVNIRTARAALECMTPKQAKAITLYAGGNSMRMVAKKMRLKDVKSVTQHIQAARRAVSRADIDLSDLCEGPAPFESRWNDGTHWTMAECDVMDAHVEVMAELDAAEWRVRPASAADETAAAAAVARKNATGESTYRPQPEGRKASPEQVEKARAASAARAADIAEREAFVRDCVAWQVERLRAKYDAIVAGRPAVRVRAGIIYRERVDAIRATARRLVGLPV